jgi:hypothetical protein
MAATIANAAVGHPAAGESTAEGSLISDSRRACDIGLVGTVRNAGRCDRLIRSLASRVSQRWTKWGLQGYSVCRRGPVRVRHERRRIVERRAIAEKISVDVMGLIVDGILRGGEGKGSLGAGADIDQATNISTEFRVKGKGAVEIVCSNISAVDEEVMFVIERIEPRVAKSRGLRSHVARGHGNPEK